MKIILYKNYRSRRDLQLSSFEFFSFEVVKMLKKINGPVWIHGLELVWASWSSTSPKEPNRRARVGYLQLAHPKKLSPQRGDYLG